MHYVCSLFNRYRAQIVLAHFVHFYIANRARFVYTNIVNTSIHGGDFVATFGSVLRQLRNNAGISQGTLAKFIGVSKSSVNMYERGEREPSFETLEAIADYFNVDMDYLLGRTPVRLSCTKGIRLNISLDMSPFSDDARPLMEKLCDAMSRMTPGDESTLSEIGLLIAEAEKRFSQADAECLFSFVEAIGELYHDAVNALQQPQSNNTDPQ